MGARWHADEMTPDKKRELILGGSFNGSNYDVWYKGGRDSLFRTLERAYWNFRGDGIGPYNIPDPPPSPDLVVTSHLDRIDLKWWYPDVSHYLDPDTGVDDFLEWRVYRKKGEREVGTLQERGSTDPDILDYRLFYIATQKGHGDTLRWTDTAVEIDQPYYYYVTAVDDGSQNSDGLVPGQGLESSHTANRTLRAAVPGEPTSIDSDRTTKGLPAEFSLSQNFPNPFNPETTINLALPVDAHVTLNIYNISGQLVRTLKRERLSAGYHVIKWDGKNNNDRRVGSGIYFFRIQAGAYAETKRMVLLK
jgi:hypothetical protein